MHRASCKVLSPYLQRSMQSSPKRMSLFYSEFHPHEESQSRQSRLIDVYLHEHTCTWFKGTFSQSVLFWGRGPHGIYLRQNWLNSKISYWRTWKSKIWMRLKKILIHFLNLTSEVEFSHL